MTKPPLPTGGRRMRGGRAGRRWGPTGAIPRHTPPKMATSVLSSKMDSLRIVGDDRARKARETDEDIAILSTFLPPSLVGQTPSSQRPFECALGKECRLGDVKLAKPGQCSCHLGRSLSRLRISLCRYQITISSGGTRCGYVWIGIHCLFEKKKNTKNNLSPIGLFLFFNFYYKKFTN